MAKKLIKMAFVCLAMLCMSSAQSPILTRPTVRVLFQDNELNAFPGHPITIDIFFRNTNYLYVWRDDTQTLTYIDLEEDEMRNNPEENQKSHTDIIYEADHTVTYTVVAESEDFDRDYADITFQTYSNPER